MKVTLSPDGHTVLTNHGDGTITEKKFTSHAEARHFVERHNNEILPATNFSSSAKKRRKNSQPKRKLTAEQQRLKDEALKRFKGLV
jgi:hypothetical protein